MDESPVKSYSGLVTSTSDNDRQLDVDFRNEYILLRERGGWTVTGLTWNREVPRLDATSLLRFYPPEEPFPSTRGDAGKPMNVAHRLVVLEAMIRELLESHVHELLVEVYRDPNAHEIERMVDRLRDEERLPVRVTTEPNRLDAPTRT